MSRGRIPVASHLCAVALLVAGLSLDLVALEPPEVLQPNEASYSAEEVAALRAAIDALGAELSQPTYASQKTFGLNGWGKWTSAEFAAYTAGILAGRGLDTRVVSAAGWPDGVHAWVIVAVSAGEHLAWIPVEASPDIGEKQPALGTIPVQTGADGSLWFDEAYLIFDRSDELPENSAPTAKIRSRGTVRMADWFSLTATGSVDRDGSIVLYVWDFGDGSPTSSVVARDVRHRYVGAGTYTVILTVVDNRGAMATVEMVVRSAVDCGCG